MINLDKIRIPFMIFIVILITFVTGYTFGSVTTEDKVIKRFKSLPDKEMYTQEEVIIIICGELQI